MLPSFIISHVFAPLLSSYLLQKKNCEGQNNRTVPFDCLRKEPSVRKHLMETASIPLLDRSINSFALLCDCSHASSRFMFCFYLLVTFTSLSSIELIVAYIALITHLTFTAVLCLALINSFQAPQKIRVFKTWSRISLEIEIKYMWTFLVYYVKWEQTYSTPNRAFKVTEIFKEWFYQSPSLFSLSDTHTACFHG